MRSSPRSIWRQGNKHGLSLRDIYMEQRLEWTTVIRRPQVQRRITTVAVTSWSCRTWCRRGEGAMIKATELAAMPPLMVDSSSSRTLVLGFGNLVVCSAVFNQGTSQTASKSHATLVFDQNMPGTSCHLPLSCPFGVRPIQRHHCL